MTPTRLQPWFVREFPATTPIAAFPGIVERLRGTSARLDERLRSREPALMVRRVDDSWSIQENVGHLLDLEPLWAGRVEDILDGRDVLRPADLQNRRTHEAGHNDRPAAELLSAFRVARTTLIERLEGLTASDLERSARHPRLDQPMRISDLGHFVAEHDDHHLARITEILRDA